MQLSGWITRFLCAAAATLLMSACGEVKGTSTDGGNGSGDAPGVDDFSLSVDMASLTIPIAGSAEVRVTVERNGAVGDISLSAGGLGTNLDAAFAPTVIPEGETTSTVTISVKGGTAAGMSTVTLTGTAGDKTHSSDVSVTTTTITVTGTVQGDRSGITVGMIGRPSVTSGAGGVFTFTDVTPPYDLYTFIDAGCGTSTTPTAYIYKGLTRPDPTVTAGVYTANCTNFFPFCVIPAPNSNVSGTKNGTGNNTDPVVWAWSAGSFNSGALNTNGTYSGNLSWCSGNSSTGAVHALQFTRKPNGAPDTFLGYAKTGNLTVQSGTPVNALSLTFTSVSTTATVTGTLNAPPGYPTPTVQLTQQFGNANEILWEDDTTAIDAAFPILAPAGGNSLYAASSLSGVGNSYFVQPLSSNTTLDFTMPAAAVLMTPANAATGVTSATPFAWTASPGTVSLVSVTGTGAIFRIFTVDEQMTIPVIPEVPLPSATQFNWSVTAYSPATINDAAGATGLEGVDPYDHSGPAHAISYSNTRSFTTP